MQPVGKKNIAADKQYEDFNRLETKMGKFQNTENELLKLKVTNEHSTWHENCQEALKAVLRQWINFNHNMEWVSRRLAWNLKEREYGLTLCRLEDKLSLGFEKERQLNEEIGEMIRKKNGQQNLPPWLNVTINSKTRRIRLMTKSQSISNQTQTNPCARGKSKDKPLGWETLTNGWILYT